MGEEDLLEGRRSRLADALESDIKKYHSKAVSNYCAQQVITWVALILTAAAALLGLLPIQVSKEIVGACAAGATALVGAGNKLGLQQKANWHYRKVDALTALNRRLHFELPLHPNADNLAAISKDWSALDTAMSKQWEDLQSEPSKPSTNANPGRGS